MKKIFFSLLLTSFVVLSGLSQVQAVSIAVSPDKEIVEHPESDANHEAADEESHSEGHGSNMAPLFFVIIALIIGAATRHFLRKTPLPYTVLLLLIGLGLGAIDRFGLLEGFGGLLSDSIKWGGQIDPHVILFVFLPTLVFEAAYAMEVHVFKKTAVNATLLAVPGIVIAMYLTGFIVLGITRSGLGLQNWSWEMALMFGAVISATDPVAVVALLKELGAGKKLATLIEGESMLNDGTAIVLFMVFFLGITGDAGDTSPVVQFFKVSLGGVLLGVAIGYVAISWVRRVFNDALVEISVIIATSYVIFFMAEQVLHVSGVLGLVGFGLLMAGIGKTRVSPEVQHFLHEFWELAAFIANTLIFIIVGVVIAQRIKFVSGDIIVLLIIYLGITLVRAIVIGVHYPFMRKIGYGMNLKDAAIALHGALRGAVGLALALVVAGVDSKYIAQDIKDQFLFLTAGIVTITLLFNAITIKWLVRKLKITQIAPAKAKMLHAANLYLHESTINSVERIRKDKFMGKANWEAVQSYLPSKPESLELDNLKVEGIAELRRRILEKEKSSYWSQFSEGMIGAVAVQKLSESIDVILDAGGTISLAQRKDLEEQWNAPKWLLRMQSIPLLNTIARRLFFERLADSYDIARAFLEAQNEATKLLDSLMRSADPNDDAEARNLEEIEAEINENTIEGMTFLRNLRKSYPEIYQAIATRQAIRSVLNFEQHTLERLEKTGRIDASEAAKIMLDIEHRMKRLTQSPPTAQLPEALEVFKNIDWMAKVEPDVMYSLVEIASSRMYAVNETIIKEGQPGNSLYFISRGTVKVQMGHTVVSLLGPGDLFGEMSIITGNNHIASIIAESPVTALRIKYLKIQRIMSDYPEFGAAIEDIAYRRAAQNILKRQEAFTSMSEKKLGLMIQEGRINKIDSGESLVSEAGKALLLTGAVVNYDDEEHKLVAPLLLPFNHFIATEPSVVFLFAPLI